MENLQNWYLALDPVMQVFWGCAIIASAVFLLQAVLTMLGMDHDLDMDVDLDPGAGDTTDLGGGLSLFSIRSLVNFFVGFGWAGISFRALIPQTWLLYVVSIAVGLLFGYMWIWLRRKLMRLEHNGAYRITDAVGKEADVYLRIPAECKGTGKVQVSINGSIHELDAMTQGESLASGTKVTIVSVSGNTVMVTPTTHNS